MGYKSALAPVRCHLRVRQICPATRQHVATIRRIAPNKSEPIALQTVTCEMILGGNPRRDIVTGTRRIEINLHPSASKMYSGEGVNHGYSCPLPPSRKNRHGDLPGAARGLAGMVFR